jgi:hypothetical protein
MTNKTRKEGTQGHGVLKRRIVVVIVPLRFAEFRFEITGAYPESLYFDSKTTKYPELSKINQRGMPNQNISWLRNLPVVFQYPEGAGG